MYRKENPQVRKNITPPRRSLPPHCGKLRTAESPWNLRVALFRQRRINSGFSGLATLGNIGLRPPPFCQAKRSSGDSKVQDGKITVVFLSRFIIRAGSVDFVLKKAEIFVLAVDSNGCAPFSLACVVRDAFVL